MKKWIAIIAFCLSLAVAARGDVPAITVAVLPFEIGQGFEATQGEETAQMLSISLSNESNLILVERAEIDKVLAEQSLSMTGAVSQTSLVQAGNLLGAHVLITGRLFVSNGKRYWVAKIIGTETSRVYGEMVQSDLDANLDKTIADLSQKLAAAINTKADTLVAHAESQDDWLKRIGLALQGKTLPTISVHIEETHLSRPVIDPAAETEIKLLLNKLGFKVVQNGTIDVTGQACSEFGLRKGDLVSCRARIEIKAVVKKQANADWVDRQTAGAIDLSEHIAAKSALENAARQLAERIALRAAGLSK